MKLEEIRQRGIDLRLKAYRDMMSRDLPASIICSLLTVALLAYLVLTAPEDWANGPVFKPGGGLFERFGFAGAVFVVRTGAALVALVCCGYCGWTIYRLTGGLKAKRADIAAKYDVFAPPDQPREQ